MSFRRSALADWARRLTREALFGGAVSFTLRDAKGDLSGLRAVTDPEAVNRPNARAQRLSPEKVATAPSIEQDKPLDAADGTISCRCGGLPRRVSS